MTIYLSPSRLGRDSCPRCLWLSNRQIGIGSSMDFKPFNLHDRLQKHALPKGTDLSRLGIPGKVFAISGWLESRDFGAGTPHFIAIRGQYDFLVELFDGGFAIVDGKTAKPKEQKAEEYRRQLSSYVLAAKEPAAFEPLDVRATYVLPWWANDDSSTFFPEVQPPEMALTMYGQAIEVPLDLEETRGQVHKLAEIITERYIPDPSISCDACMFVREYGAAVRESRELKAKEETAVAA